MVCVTLCVHIIFYTVHVHVLYVSFSTCHIQLHIGLHWQREKEVQIDKALGSTSVDIEALRRHAVSLGGLFHSDIRKKVWPKLVGVNMYGIKPYEGAPLINYKDRAQVLLDVNRCSRRIPERKYEYNMCI